MVHPYIAVHTLERLVCIVAAVELLGDPMTSVLEDGSGDGGSAVEICLKLVVDLPLDRNVIVSLDPEDVTTGQENDVIAEMLMYTKAHKIKEYSSLYQHWFLYVN